MSHDGKERVRFGYFFLSVAIFLVVSLQITNNQAGEFFQVLSPGKLAVASFVLLGVMYLLAGGGIEKRSGNTFLVICLFIYVISAGAALAVSARPGLATGFFMTTFAQAFFAIALLLFVSREKKYHDAIVWALCVLFLLLSTLNVFNAYWDLGFLEVRGNASREIGGVMLAPKRVVSITNLYGQFNVYVILGWGASLALIMRIRQSLIRTVLILGTYLLAMGAVVSSGSRAGLVGLGVAFVAYVVLRMLRRGAWAWIPVLSMLAVAVALAIQWLIPVLQRVGMNTIEQRYSGYKDALQIIVKTPLGVGQGGFRMVTGHDAVIHNTILDAFLVSGWLGGVMFLVLAITPMLYLIRVRSSEEGQAHALMAGYCGAFVVAQFYSALTDYFIFMMCAIAVGWTVRMRKSWFASKPVGA